MPRAAGASRSGAPRGRRKDGGEAAARGAARGDPRMARRPPDCAWTACNDPRTAHGRPATTPGRPAGPGVQNEPGHMGFRPRSRWSPKSPGRDRLLIGDLGATGHFVKKQHEISAAYERERAPRGQRVKHGRRGRSGVRQTVDAAGRDPCAGEGFQTHRRKGGQIGK